MMAQKDAPHLSSDVRTKRMIIESQGRRYEIMKGSDVQRDGVYVDLTDITDENDKEYIMEIFHSDENGLEIFSSEKTEIPYEVLLKVIEISNQWLKPSEVLTSGSS